MNKNMCVNKIITFSAMVRATAGRKQHNEVGYT